MIKLNKLIRWKQTVFYNNEAVAKRDHVGLLFASATSEEFLNCLNENKESLPTPEAYLPSCILQHLLIYTNAPEMYWILRLDNKAIIPSQLTPSYIEFL